jgi:hypothetical protein
MKESVFITTIVYAFYSILLGLFGILLGFLLGVYRRKEQIDDNDIYLFILLLLLNILYKKGFDDVLFDLPDSSLAPNIAKPFKPLPQIQRRTLKMILKEP